jgi:hypothetical protein
MALLPYSVRQVTQRKGGRRDRGDRGELRDENAPRSPEVTEADYVELDVEEMPDGVEITEIDEVEAVETEGAEA